MIRWIEPTPEERQRAEDEAAQVIHGTAHAADRHSPHSRGPSAARAILNRMSRVTRNQRDRDDLLLGYRDLGGEGGIS